MPHTTTKVARKKRDDVRPNGKHRKVLAKTFEAKKTIQDLRVTKKKTAEKVERQVGGVLSKTKSDNEKITRSLRKKMVAIEKLIAIQDAGGKLDDQQLAKIDTLDQILEEIESFAAQATNVKT